MELLEEIDLLLVETARAALLEQLSARDKKLSDIKSIIAAQLGTTEQVILGQLLAVDERRCCALERTASAQAQAHERHLVAAV